MGTGTPRRVFGTRDSGTRDLGRGDACMGGRGDAGTRGRGDVGMGFTLAEVSKLPCLAGLGFGIPLVAESGTGNLEKPTWSTLASLFLEEIGRMTPRLGQFGQISSCSDAGEKERLKQLRMAKKTPL